MSATLALTAIYEPVENGWIQARIAEFPSVITAAPTRDAAADQLIDALKEYLLALQETGAVPPDHAITGRLTLTIDGT